MDFYLFFYLFFFAIVVQGESIFRHIWKQDLAVPSHSSVNIRFWGDEARKPFRSVKVVQL